LSSLETIKALPSQSFLQEALRFDDESGRLFWRHRPVSHFKSLGAARSWNKRNAGVEAFTRKSHGYKCGKIGGVYFFAHRVIWKMVTGEDPAIVDHINGQRDDNRFQNLNSGSQSENMTAYFARASDDLTLRSLKMRDAGMTSQEVAKEIGKSPEWVRTATARVVKDDLATGDDCTGFYDWFNDTTRRASA